MSMKKIAAILAAGALAAVLGLAGCASSGSSSAASASGSASAESASASAASESASASAAAADTYTLLNDGKIVFGTSPDWPPFEYLEGDEFVGLDIAIAQAIGEKLGLEVEFKAMEFDSIIPAIAAGGQVDAGISGFSVDPERAKEIDFTDGYYIDDLAIAAMKGGNITADNVDEALNQEGVTIAVQLGTTGEAHANENYPNATVTGYGNSTDCFAAMQAGQADAVCTNLGAVEGMLAKAYPDAEIVKSIATGEPFAIVVSKDNPALTAAINAALAELQADGTIDALIAQYL